MPTHPLANETFPVTSLVGSCLAPFLDQKHFPATGGYTAGRFCAPIDLLPGKPVCCLPCPATEWAYSTNFASYSVTAEWLNVLGLILLVFLLASYVFLPIEKTRMHYLSTGLCIAVGFITLGFTIPLASQPDQCYNEITPNDMFTLTECAWSGAFIVAGALCAISWIFIRALSMNLQICWDIVPGKKFFYFSQALGWGIPAALFTVTMTVTGVSFRFGNACHVNHEHSMADFWGPLIGFSAAAGVLQITTFAYCLNVYLRNLWSGDGSENSTQASGGLPSYSNSVRTQTARAVYLRLKKVIWLQWRGIAIVTIILVDVIFFAIVFLSLDSLQVRILDDVDKVIPWLICLASNPNNRNKCVSLTDGWIVNEPTVAAVLFLLSLAGFQVFTLLGRFSILSAWRDLFTNRFTQRQEFVSLDAARPEVMRAASKQDLLRYDRGHETTTFEMQKPSYATGISGPMTHGLDAKRDPNFDDDLASPTETYRSPHHQNRSSEFSNPRDRTSDFADQQNNRTSDYSNPRDRTSDFAFPQDRRSPAPQYSHTPPAQAYSQHNQSTQRRAPSRQRSNEYFPPVSREREAYTSHSHNLSGDSAAARASLEAHRRYMAPSNSFSAPKTPSRQNSLNRNGFAPQEIYYGRGGLALNPPSETGESDDEFESGRRTRSPHQR